jgi:hypothetical protein
MEYKHEGRLSGKVAIITGLGKPRRIKSRIVLTA